MTELEKPPPELKKTPLSSSQSQLSKQLGRCGEQRALHFLQNLQYTILETNFKSGHGEIDIIARDPQTHETVFVEVKTRSSWYYGNPSLAVGPAKLRSITRVARVWLRQHKSWGECRFDCLAICENQVEHYMNITWSRS